MGKILYGFETASWAGKAQNGTIEIPNGYTEISTYAFQAYDCSGIIIPNSVTKICKYAFYKNLPNLREIHLPSSVKEIEDCAFCDVPQLTIYIDNLFENIKCSPAAFSNENISVIFKDGSTLAQYKMREQSKILQDKYEQYITNQQKYKDTSKVLVMLGYDKHLAFSACAVISKLLNISMNNACDLRDLGDFGPLYLKELTMKDNETEILNLLKKNGIIAKIEIHKEEEHTKKNNNINLMAKKSAISGEYVISVEDSGSITVYRIFDNVKASLREAAEIKGFEYDSNWTTRQFGSKICKEFGDGKSAVVGNYYIHVKGDGGIETYRTYDNTKEALRTVATNIGFTVDSSWTTRQLGSKLIDEINK